MNFMKHTLVTIFSVGLLASSAVMAGADPAKFQAIKDSEVANLQEKLQIVQEHLSCTQAAADHAALKACHEAAKTKMGALDAKIKAEHTKPQTQP